MFSTSFNSDSKSQRKAITIAITINDYTFETSKDFAMFLSPVIKQYFKKNKNSSCFHMQIPDLINPFFRDDYVYISLLFRNKPIFINFRNKGVLSIIAKELKIEELNNKIQLFDDINDTIINNETIILYSEFSKLLVSLNDTNFEESLIEVKDRFSQIDQQFMLNMTLTISETIPQQIEIIIRLLITIDQQKQSNIIQNFVSLVFEDILNYVHVKPACFIIRLLKKENILSDDQISELLYKLEHQKYGGNKSNSGESIIDTVIFRTDDVKFLITHHDTTGDNPDYYFQILKHDDLDSLIACSTKLDFSSHMYAQSCDYDRYMIFSRNHYIRKEGFSFIDICAYFGSTKCFDFLLINNYEITQQTANFAIAGGSSEIIRKADQENMLKISKIMFSYAIYFHRYETFEWLLEKLDCYNVVDYPNNFPYPNDTIDFFTLMKNNSCLIETIKCYNIDTMLCLLSNGAPCECLFIYSMIYDNFYLSKLALSMKHRHGYRPLSCYFGSEPPIHIAIFKNQIDIVESLINEYIVNINDEWNNLSPIESAMQLGHKKLVEILYSHKNINISPTILDSLLYLSLKGNQIDLYRMFQQKKPKLNSVNKNHQSILQTAIKFNHIELSWELLKNPKVRCFIEDNMV
ncbi:hypothetical protein TRFO_38742 [Tritrichomonas foetus]|uniref:DUF3447 domain-containing protein n=1 Tax=Tritrichomonas foetus TaxID=1144522 RepID=A0A1J4J7G3_9EUKA|nr:hypothetical protein TRFO_38742 [Tritrichomonas foetus]|eukprot:OHS95072.1 hypothetical protein TRFO_38742 [Tritrichomonas foetus]